MLRRALVLGIVIAIGVAALRSTLPTAAEDRAPAAARNDDTPPVQVEQASIPLGAPTEVEKVLAENGLLHFNGVPLKDFAPKLAAQLRLNVLLDRKALAEANISDELQVDVSFTGMRLSTGLRQALQRHSLGYYAVADKVLLITTQEQVAGHDVFRIYDVRDLVGYNEAHPNGTFRADYDSLIDLITSIVSPSTWPAGTGPGPIAPIDGCIVIPQMEEVQEQIGALLSALRRVRDAGPEGCEPVVLNGPHSPQAAAVDVQLEKPQDIHFGGGTLTTLKAWLKALGVEMRIDREAADEIGNEPGFSGCDLRQVSLGFALHWLLNERDLDYLIADDGLVITTRERAKRRLECVVFPLGPLSDSVRSTDTFTQPSDVEALVRAAAGKDSWDDQGGPGSVMVFPRAKALVCVQTHEALKRIGKHVAELRTNVKKSATTDSGKPPADKSAPTIVVYHLSILAGNSRAAASDSDVAQYAKVVHDLVEPKSWTDGSGYIAAVPGGIVVRQSPSVQEKVRKLLDDLDALGPIGALGGFQGGAFGPVEHRSPSPSRIKVKAGGNTPDTTKISNGQAENTK